MRNRQVPVVEVFGPTLQGEGAHAGLRTMFIRFGYCDGAGKGGWCTWCDSMFAVDPKNKDKWEWLWPAEIMERLRAASKYCMRVTLSGGNPAVHDLGELINHLRTSAYTINVETQGTIWQDWLGRCHTVTVSPKPPSAGSACDLERLDSFMTELQHRRISTAYPIMKIVVDPMKSDLQFARCIFDRYPWVSDKYISVITHPDDTPETILQRYRVLADRVIHDETLGDIGVLPQLHCLLWGHSRGV